MTNVFKIAGRSGYFGKVQLAPKLWRRKKLFRDKLASQRRLAELQTEADRRASGVRTNITDHELRPMDQHVDDYIQSLGLRVSSPDHLAISESMLRRLVKATGWKFIRDMTIESVERVLPELAATESYRNGFIKRGKAFASWLEEQGRVAVHPLRKLKRVSEKNATRTRARRAATADEKGSLFGLTMPDDRRLAYAFGAYNGLRRNEIAKLTWDRLHLSATIPFIDVAQKNGTSGAVDSIPLHPYVVKLLNARTAGMPGVSVVRSVPDMKTMVKDMKRAKIEQTDARDRRLDFHALRHTFATCLDMAGCSRATKKRLMRHAGEDVTDGYSHAELAEMQAALCKLEAPAAVATMTMTATGTEGATFVGQMGPPAGPARDPRLTPLGTQHGTNLRSSMSISTRQNRAERDVCHQLTPLGLPLSTSGDTVEISRPDTQVD